MDKERRPEDLLLIFYSNATKELGKGKLPGDDAWKLMVDRHVALFLRLVSSILQDEDWARERPELAQRLATMEKKLLMHDQDLTSENDGQRWHYNRSRSSADLPGQGYAPCSHCTTYLCRGVFRRPGRYRQTQVNLDRESRLARPEDISSLSLSLMTNKTLNSDDFDLDEAYDAWKHHEVPELSQMILAIIQSNPELAKSSSGGAAQGYGAAQRQSSNLSENGSPYDITQNVDLNSLNISDSPTDGDSYTFIPPDPRAYYRAIAKEVLVYDIADAELHPSEDGRLLSKQSTELLSEIATRWRLPLVSRLILFMDVVREKYLNHESAWIQSTEPSITLKNHRLLTRSRTE